MNSLNRRLLMVAMPALITLGACSAVDNNPSTEAEGGSTLINAENLPEGQATAVFAMGCFWCAEADFEKVDGVIDVVSGYTGGDLENPSYEQVTYGDTGHYEAVLVTYDTTKLEYSDLLAVFWKNVDPFDADGQFCDKGSSYLSGIFPGNKAETEAARASKAKWEEELGEEIETAIVQRSEFWGAETYHQDYYSKNPVRYSFYRSRCDRDDRLEEVWGSVG